MSVEEIAECGVCLALNQAVGLALDCGNCPVVGGAVDRGERVATQRVILGHNRTCRNIDERSHPANPRAMGEPLLLQAEGRVAVSPDRKTGEAILHFTEPSGRRVEVRLTDASFESLAFSVAR